MLIPIHVQVTRTALEGLMSDSALRAVLGANAWVDAPWNQLGHDELHFDNNAFDASYAYVERQRALIEPAMRRGEPRKAWRAFGRLIHTAQDFYSHSNYVDLWLACQPNGMVPAPAEIDPSDDALVASPSLRSGKAYAPVGFLAFVPGLGRLVTSFLPADSHAHMNLDSPASGTQFEYAYHAAVKRTRQEFDRVVGSLNGDGRAGFTGLPAAGSPPPGD
jgi:hypothetical protein